MPDDCPLLSGPEQSQETRMGSLRPFVEPVQVGGAGAHITLGEFTGDVFTPRPRISDSE